MLHFIKKHMFAVIVGVIGILVGALAFGRTLITAGEKEGLANVKITQEQAMQIAKDHTGIQDLAFETVVLDIDDDDDDDDDDDFRQPHYDIDAKKDNVEHDLEIDAITGQVLSYSTENDKNAKKNGGAQKTTDTGTMLSEDQVKQIVADHTKKNNLTFTKIHLDDDDDDDYGGQRNFEVDAHADGTKYEIDVNAVTGEILKSEVKNASSATSTPAPATPTTPAPGTLSEDDVKKIVADTTGNPNLTYTKIRLDDDDNDDDDDYAGRRHFDVEAYEGTTKYDLDIDAQTGEVLKTEVEQQTPAPAPSNPAPTYGDDDDDDGYDDGYDDNDDDGYDD